MKKRILVLLAAVGLLWAGTVLAAPAGATHGGGLQQDASAALSLPSGVLAAPEVCTGPSVEECRRIEIGQPVSSLGVTLDYVLLDSRTHLPDIMTSAGMTGVTCRTGPKAGQQVPGVAVGLSAGDSMRLSRVTVAVSINGEETSVSTVVPGDNRTGAFGPVSVGLC